MPEWLACEVIRVARPKPTSPPPTPAPPPRAYQAGGLLGWSGLPYQHVTDRLTDAGTASGLSPGDARRITRRALANGTARPIPPQLVAMLRERMERFGTAPDGRIFRSVNGARIQPSTYWHFWRKVRALSLTPELLVTPLMKRPYDLQHSGVTWRLNCGIPAPEVAKWAGHSVELLTRIYTKCVAGLDDVWISRMDSSLGNGDNSA